MTYPYGWLLQNTQKTFQQNKNQLKREWQEVTANAECRPSQRPRCRNMKHNIPSKEKIIKQTFNQSVSHPASQLVGRSVGRSVGPSVGRSVGRSAGRSVRQSVSQSVSQFNSFGWCVMFQVLTFITKNTIERQNDNNINLAYNNLQYKYCLVKRTTR